MKIKKIMITVLILTVIVVGLACGFQQRQPLDYTENINETAVTIDGEELTLADLAFYVLYVERQVEQQAEIYNAENTKDYWNLHINGIFIQADAKNTIMQMAIHDRIFYHLAMEENMGLTEDEEQRLSNIQADFWMDLLDVQQDKIPVSDENINQTIEQIALARKYQDYLVKQNHAEDASYDWDGYYYEQLMEQEHEVKINKKIWDRIVVGDITLEHDAPNYVNTRKTKEE